MESNVYFGGMPYMDEAYIPIVITAAEWTGNDLTLHKADGSTMILGNCVRENISFDEGFEEETMLPQEIAAKVAQSKSELAEYLAAYPLLSPAHGEPALYSATSEKQALLTSTLVMAQGAAQAGVPYEVTWNASGHPCEVWEVPQLQQLAFEMAAYVKPLVAYQQGIEVALNACTTLAEVEAVAISYAAVPADESKVVLAVAIAWTCLLSAGGPVPFLLQGR